MTATEPSAACLPPPPARAFLVGIGGIGMSGLAQYLQARGYSVAGSDRLLTGPGREELVEKLRRLGVPVYPQDGSGPRHALPDVLVTSAAVEPGNPDIEACPQVPVCPRARALAALLDRDPGIQIAVAGSAGKTSVTGWLASCLRHLGRRVLVVDGGYMLDAESADRPGNFAADPDPEFLVVEVDESDRSLVEFSPHVGVLLNVGTDHYGRDELVQVFGRFLDRCRQACVLPADLADELAGHGPARRVHFGSKPEAESHTSVRAGDERPTPNVQHSTLEGKSVAARSASSGAHPSMFDVRCSALDVQPAILSPTGGPQVVSPADYTPGPRGAAFTIPGAGQVCSRQFGYHSAVNAAAVAAALQAAGVAAPPALLANALGAFRGIRQRFEYVGVTAASIPVYNDYAHNVQKIAAAIATAREAGGSPMTILFQPHGYGPFGFMREALRTTLAEVLCPDDRFILLPVYYAGGSSSFSPTSAEVAAEYAAAGLPVQAVEPRQAALAAVAGNHSAKAVLVLGARDPSLPDFAAHLCRAE